MWVSCFDSYFALGKVMIVALRKTADFDVCKTGYCQFIVIRK